MPRSPAPRATPSELRSPSAPFTPIPPIAAIRTSSFAPSPAEPEVSSSPLTDFLERIFPIGILALAIFGVPILVLQPEGLPRMRALQHELSDVTGENETLRRRVGDLRGEVKRLRDDPAAVERIARDQLGLVRKSEIVFQFPASSSGQSSSLAHAPLAPDSAPDTQQ